MIAGNRLHTSDKNPGNRAMSVKHKGYKPVCKLGFEPGRLGRHYLAGVGNRHEILADSGDGGFCDGRARVVAWLQLAEAAVEAIGVRCDRRIV